MIGEFWCPSLKNWLTFEKQNETVFAFTAAGDKWERLSKEGFWVVDYDGYTKAVYLSEGQLFRITLTSTKLLIVEQFNESTNSFSKLNQPARNKAFLRPGEAKDETINVLKQIETALSNVQPDEVKEDDRPPSPHDLEEFAKQDQNEIDEARAQREALWNDWKKLNIREHLVSTVKSDDFKGEIAQKIYESFEAVLFQFFNLDNYHTMSLYRAALEDCLSNPTNISFKELQTEAAKTQIDRELSLSASGLHAKKLKFILAVLKAERDHLLNHHDLDITELTVINIEDQPRSESPVRIPEEKHNTPPPVFSPMDEWNPEEEDLYDNRSPFMPGRGDQDEAVQRILRLNDLRNPRQKEERELQEALDNSLRDQQNNRPSLISEVKSNNPFDYNENPMPRPDSRVLRDEDDLAEINRQIRELENREQKKAPEAKKPPVSKEELLELERERLAYFEKRKNEELRTRQMLEAEQQEQSELEIALRLSLEQAKVQETKAIPPHLPLSRDEEGFVEGYHREPTPPAPSAPPSVHPNPELSLNSNNRQTPPPQSREIGQNRRSSEDRFQQEPSPPAPAPSPAPNNYYFQLKCYLAEGIISALLLVGGILLASLDSTTTFMAVGSGVACIGLFGVAHSLYKMNGLVDPAPPAPQAG